MSVSIKSIQVKKAGPLSQFQGELGKLNLIYGLNESGKTYLVEFLLRSLFRPARSWNLREDGAEGSVEIDGLDQQPVLFSPVSSRKLEDYWKEADSGLPANLSRLLVVKGGELALSPGNRGGVSREVLKNSLTSQALLDYLWDSIQPTVRNASLEGGQIQGKNMGKLKDHNLLSQDLDRLAKLLAEVQENYSRGPLRQILDQLEKVQSEIDCQEFAKRHLAFELGKDIQGLEALESTLSEVALGRQRDRIRDFNKSQAELRSLEDRHTDQKQKSRGYRWLEAALEIWEEQGLEGKAKPSPTIGFISFAGLAAGLVLLLLEFYLWTGDMFWIGTALSLSGLGLSLFYLIRLLKWAGELDDTRERKKIIGKFEEKFGYAPDSLADLREQKNKLHDIYLQSQATLDLIDEKKNLLELESQRIEIEFERLAGETVKPEHWQEQIDQLSNQQAQYKKEIVELKLRLSKLNIPEDAFREESAPCSYDPALLETLGEEKAVLEREIDGIEGNLDTLKARACERTGDDINTPWPDVFYHLTLKHKDLAAEHQRLTADIMSEIGLTSVLTRLREAEDQKIIKALNGPEVSSLIKEITGRYQRVDLVDDQLLVYDKYTHYPLQDLSTGAREQILLALRLGIASRLCAGDALFLILDDAFQHSDWQRRNALVESTIELVSKGWQVLYLSMDEHIRDLFESKAKPAIKKDFRQINLG